MVIACPDPLGLALPLVVAVATSLSAGNGVLIRDRAAFQRAHDLNAVVFDRTGSLTEGGFGVSDLALMEGGDETTALRLAASIESQSQHPIGMGIVAAEMARGIDLSAPAICGGWTGP